VSWSHVCKTGGANQTRSSSSISALWSSWRKISTSSFSLVTSCIDVFSVSSHCNYIICIVFNNSLFIYTPEWRTSDWVISNFHSVRICGKVKWNLHHVLEDLLHSSQTSLADLLVFPLLLTILSCPTSSSEYHPDFACAASVHKIIQGWQERGPKLKWFLSRL